jgi:hypothetical protein
MRDIALRWPENPIHRMNFLNFMLHRNINSFDTPKATD